MSPRKTRRGAKSEGVVNDTLSETISMKSLAETPEKKKRTRRQGTKTIAPESDMDQSPEMNKSKRKTIQTIQATPSKSTRSRKTVLLDNTVNEEPEISAVTTTKTRRTRRGKENETLVDQTILLDSTTKDESISNVNKSRGTRARKKTAKKAEVKSSDEEAAPTREINASAAINVTIIDSTINDNAAPMSDEDTEVLQVSSRISRLKAAAATPASILPPNRRSRSAKQRLEDFTPESSPITVNLTPHRTTKTPRKSPMNLGSPKSHADAPQRLSKTPRKLPVVVESPVPSEMSVNSSTHSTPEKSDEKLNNSKKQDKSPKARKSPSKSPRHSPSKVVAVRKFSKSPKIVLRSPKPKSAKSKTPKVIASKVKRSSIPKRLSKSPLKKSQTPVKSPARKSLKSPRKSPSPKKLGEPTSPRRSLKQSTKSLGSPALMSLQLARIDSPSSSRESKLFSPTSKLRVSNVQSPTVILKKISSTSVSTPETVTRTSLRRTPIEESPKSTPVKSASAEKRSSQGGESPHRAKSTGKKRSAITDSGTPLRPIDSPGESAAAKLAAGKSIILSSSNTPVHIEKTNASSGSGGVRMLSSTPRERIRRSLNLSPGLGLRSEVVNSPLNGEVPVGSSTMISEGRSKRRSFRIDDESNPLISEDESFNTSPRGDASRLDGTFEVVKDKEATMVVENEQEKSGNGTYDLAEPKTPSLRRKAAKRSLGDLDTSVEERAVKRTCRVRFASPTSNDEEHKTIGTPIGRSRSATPGHRVVAKRTSQTPNGTGILAGTATTPGGNTTENKSRRRSNSMTNVSLLKTPVGAKRRSNSVSDANARSAIRKAQTASANRLSKPRLSIPSTKKAEVKTPVARKAPNFAQIHQKKFAAMESLVDAKKRVEKRHIAISTKIPTNMTRVKLPVPTNIKLPTNLKVPSNIKIPTNIQVPTKPAPSTQPIAPVAPVNGAYNRYGFKLRKDDATKMITQKKPPPMNSQKKQNENRLLLKGVRTNRRFDLIMKARNINI